MADYQSDFSDIKQAFKEAFTGVAGIAKDIAVSAGDRAKALGRTAKLGMELKSEKENANKIYAEIGKLYYETFKEAPGEFFVQLCDEARICEESIAALEAEITASGADAGVEIGFGEVVDEAEEEADGLGVDIDITIEKDK